MTMSDFRNVHSRQEKAASDLGNLGAMFQYQSRKNRRRQGWEQDREREGPPR